MQQNYQDRGRGWRGGRGGRGRGYADGFRRRSPDSNSRANNRFGPRSRSPQGNNRGGSRSNSCDSDGNRSPSGFRGPSGSDGVRRQNSPSGFRRPESPVRSNDVRRQNMPIEQNRMEQNYGPRNPRRHENVLGKPGNNSGGSRSNTWDSDENRSPSGFRRPPGSQDVKMQNPDSGFRRPESPVRSNDVRRQNSPMGQNRMEQNFEPRNSRGHENVVERPGNNSGGSRSNTWDSDENRSPSGFRRPPGTQDVRIQKPVSGFRRPESPIKSNDVRRQSMAREQNRMEQNFEPRNPKRYESGQERPGSTMRQRQRDPRWNEPRQHQNRDSRLNSPAPSQQSFQFSENWSRDTSPRGDDWHRRRSPSPTPSNWSRDRWNERSRRDDQERRRSPSPLPEAHNGPSSSRRPRSHERRSPELKPYERKYENVQQDMSAERIAQQIREAAMSGMSESEFGGSRAEGTIRQGSVTPRGSERRGSGDRWSRMAAGEQDRNQPGCSAWGSGRPGDVTTRRSERGGSDDNWYREGDQRYSPSRSARQGDVMPFESERRDSNDSHSRQPNSQGYPPRGYGHQEDSVTFGSVRRDSNDSRARHQDHQGDLSRVSGRPEDVIPRRSERSSSIESRSRQQGPQRYSPRGSDRQGDFTPRGSERGGSNDNLSRQQGPLDSGRLGPRGSEKEGSNDSRPRGFDPQGSNHQSPEPHRLRSNSYGSDYLGSSHPSPTRENWSTRSPDDDMHPDDSGGEPDSTFSLNPTLVEVLRQEVANPLGLRGARNPRGRGAPRGRGFMARGGFIGRGGFGMRARRREVLNDREMEEVPEEEEIRLQETQNWMQGPRRPPYEPAYLWNRNFMGRPYPQGPLPEVPVDLLPDLPDSSLIRHLASKDAQYRFRNDCIYCGKNTHQHDKCPFVPDIKERRNWLLSRGHCLRCFRPHRHTGRECEEMGRNHACWYCRDSDPNDLHHSSICPVAVNQETSIQPGQLDRQDLPDESDRQNRLPDSSLIRHLASKDAQDHFRHDCIYCGKNTHQHDKCPFVPDINERRDYLLSRGRCLRCFRPHRATGRECEEMGRNHACWYCRDSDPDYLHHSSICPVAVNQEASIQPGQLDRHDRPDQHDRPGQPDRPPIRHLASKDAQEQLRNSCLYCGRYTHPHDKCPFVPDINERKDYLLLRERCLRCFRFHIGRGCEEMGQFYRCRYCYDGDPNYLHHQSICPVAVNQEAPN